MNLVEGGIPVFSSDTREKTALILTRGELSLEETKSQQSKNQSRAYAVSETMKDVMLRKGLTVEIPTTQKVIVERDGTGQVRLFFTGFCCCF